MNSLNHCIYEVYRFRWGDDTPHATTPTLVNNSPNRHDLQLSEQQQQNPFQERETQQISLWDSTLVYTFDIPLVRKSAIPHVVPDLGVGGHPLENHCPH
ncbi:hypothetical protein CEXT_510741 [Caerostris extrusa]|uniref:Uncharacterized protein n=1 Tax=Caerostris extrusa TaxID=172846 RepID=A0AAV4WL99_CAEEX|nr:hypothetical protein CEXT_510741 [Caerostris extrusa]